MKRILTPITYLLAALYLCADFIFAGIAKPLSKWVAGHFELQKLRDWIRSLSPYPCLALFSIPVIALEPVKFLAAYMAATGNFLSAVLTFIVGELFKLVLIERLFDLTRDKLMRISAFAWMYGHYSQMRAWIVRSEAWQAIRSMGRSILYRVKNWRDIASRRLAWGHGDRKSGYY